MANYQVIKICHFIDVSRDDRRFKSTSDFVSHITGLIAGLMAQLVFEAEIGDMDMYRVYFIIAPINYIDPPPTQKRYLESIDAVMSAIRDRHNGRRLSEFMGHE